MVYTWQLKVCDFQQPLGLYHWYHTIAVKRAKPVLCGWMEDSLFQAFKESEALEQKRAPSERNERGCRLSLPVLSRPVCTNWATGTGILFRTASSRKRRCLLEFEQFWGEIVMKSSLECIVFFVLCFLYLALSVSGTLGHTAESNRWLLKSFNQKLQNIYKLTVLVLLFFTLKDLFAFRSSRKLTGTDLPLKEILDKMLRQRYFLATTVLFPIDIRTLWLQCSPGRTEIQHSGVSPMFFRPVSLNKAASFP